LSALPVTAFLAASALADTVFLGSAKLKGSSPGLGGSPALKTVLLAGTQRLETAAFDGSTIGRISRSFSPSAVWSPSAECAPSALRLTAAIRASGLRLSAGFGGTQPLNTSGALTVSRRFPASAAFVRSSPKEDNKQIAHRQNIGLLAGIIGGALLLILLAALLIWRLLRRSGDIVTSSLPSQLQTDTLDATEDIDFGAMTFHMNPIEELPIDVNAVEPDESLVSVQSIVDDFL
jgi:hypothetical protein